MLDNVMLSNIVFVLRIIFFLKIIQVYSLSSTGGNNQVVALVTTDSLVAVAMAFFKTYYVLQNTK